MSELGIKHVEQLPGTCRYDKQGGIDGRGLFLLAWCQCGFNRTRTTRHGARKALLAHQAGKAVR